MKVHKTTLILLLLAATAAQAGRVSSNLAEYSGYSERAVRAGNPEELVLTLKYDVSGNVVEVDGIGLELERCDEKFKCLIYSGIAIVVPSDCASISQRSWSYDGYEFRVIRNLDAFNPSDNKSIDRTKFLISVRNGGKTAGYFTYSSEMGVHSFVFSSGQQRRWGAQSYYLTSRSGMHAGGCVFSPEE